MAHLYLIVVECFNTRYLYPVMKLRLYNIMLKN